MARSLVAPLHVDPPLCTPEPQPAGKRFPGDITFRRTDLCPALTSRIVIGYPPKGGQTAIPFGEN